AMKKSLGFRPNTAYSRNAARQSRPADRFAQRFAQIRGGVGLAGPLRKTPEAGPRPGANRNSLVLLCNAAGQFQSTETRRTCGGDAGAGRNTPSSEMRSQPVFPRK